MCFYDNIWRFLTNDSSNLNLLHTQSYIISQAIETAHFKFNKSISITFFFFHMHLQHIKMENQAEKTDAYQHVSWYCVRFNQNMQDIFFRFEWQFLDVSLIRSWSTNRKPMHLNESNTKQLGGNYQSTKCIGEKYINILHVHRLHYLKTSLL